jgi:hypothetical protein
MSWEVFPQGWIAMNLQRTASLCLFSLFMASTVPVAAQSASHAPVYDSAAKQASLPAYVAGTPESDGRPGQYYFGVGAQAFTRHEYSFAINMYQVAASWAYKPAEYNLGVMYGLGQGIPVDLPRAMAWMTLAAERNNPTYVHARELVRSNLTPAQLEQANVILQELTPRYGDKVALRRAKSRWAQVRSSMTGSRVGSVSAPLSVGANHVGSSGSMATSNGAMSKPVSMSPGELTGSAAIDGSVAYQQLTASNNPYDREFVEPTGTATVGPLAPVKTKRIPDTSKVSASDAADQP